MNNLQKLGGITALLAGLIYIIIFAIYGAMLDYPTNPDTMQKVVFYTDNQLLLSVASFIGYILFGIVLSFLVLALYQRLQEQAPNITKLATIFGLIWVGLVITCGLITNIGLAAVVKLAVEQPEQAMAALFILTIITEGMGGGNEIVGGLWVLLISIASLKSNGLSKSFNYLGVFVGSVGILTTYPAEILTMTFGLSQIIWFIWLGIIMLKDQKGQTINSSA